MTITPPPTPSSPTWDAGRAQELVPCSAAFLNALLRSQIGSAAARTQSNAHLGCQQQLNVLCHIASPCRWIHALQWHMGSPRREASVAALMRSLPTGASCQAGCRVGAQGVQCIPTQGQPWSVSALHAACLSPGNPVQYPGLFHSKRLV